VRLCPVAAKPTDAVTYGLLPAAARLGLEVFLLTDQPDTHAGVLARERTDRGAQPRIIGCDVHDARALIGRISGLPRVDAVFSNSDHLQVQTALAADYFGLPGKDWRAALRARDKVLMRRRLAQTGTEHVAAAEVTTGAPLRQPGDHISLTHTNRDYLGVICALGPDPAAVERAVRDQRTSGPWEITAEIAP
jgi:hypothetical protein